MAAPVPVDVLDRLVERVDDADRHLQVEVLGVPVVGCSPRRPALAGRGARPLVADQLDARVPQLARRPRQQRLGDGGVDQQRLGRVADAGALDLRVVGDPRPPSRGRRPRARRRGSCRRPRTSRAPSRPPSARPSGHRRRAGSPGRRGPRRSPARPAPRDRPRAARRSPRAAPVSASASRTSAASAPFEPLGVARPAQHDRVAALEAERGAVDRHVRPRLVDHGDHAERHAQLAHLDPAAKRPALDLLADRIGQRRRSPRRRRPSPRPARRSASAGREAPPSALRRARPPDRRAFASSISALRSRSSRASRATASRPSDAPLGREQLSAAPRGPPRACLGQRCGWSIAIGAEKGTGDPLTPARRSRGARPPPPRAASAPARRSTSSP